MDWEFAAMLEPRWGNGENKSKQYISRKNGKINKQIL